MDPYDKNDEVDEDDSNPSSKRDVWFKLRAIGGIATALVVAVIGALGSFFLHSLQESSNKITLYSQLMSEQQKAENAVRKDMFTTILASFLDKKEDTDDECTVDKIDRQLLELEMISRNFHETMDLRPLFIHVLLNIVRNMPQNYNISDGDAITFDTLDECRQELLYRLFHDDVFNGADPQKRKQMVNDFIEVQKESMKRRLISIAQRITRKQLESLSDVERRLRFRIDLSKSCKDIPPTQPLPENDPCVKAGSSRQDVELIIDDPMNSGGQSKRVFSLSSNRSYPDWNLVRLRVVTNKLSKEIRADPDGGEENVAAFWIGYFDFPLVDNTYLSTKERYAVILDSIDENEAMVSLLYFPASYAGFKEKSYYQHRIMNTLLKDRFLMN